MSIKAPRGLTHGRRLYQPELWIERNVRAWTLLSDRSAVLLVQLPPDLQRDDMRLAWFLKRLSAAGSVPVAVRSSGTRAGSTSRCSRSWRTTAPPTW